MQAAISLCYFCENHGPRGVMICQPLRNSLREKASDILFGDDAMDTDECLPRFYGDISAEEVNDEEERCAACSSFGSGLGILSNDHEAETSYVSTQMPTNSRLHSIVKQACLRSLSVEISTPLFVDTSLNSSDCFVGPSYPLKEEQHSSNLYYSSNACSQDISKEFLDKDGVVLFGDEENGYTLSHTFRLKDARARGFHRSYSLIVISKDKLMLLSNYEFFLGGFSAMISKLQTMANECFAIEQKVDNDLRLVASTHTTNRNPWIPQQFYPRHFALDTSRSLCEITNNKDIFTILHRQMLYLLKTQTTLNRDTVLEGVPTQDMLVLMEMEQNSLEENDLITSLSTQQTFYHLKNLMIIVERFKAFSLDLLTVLIWRIIIGEQVLIKSDVPIARRLFLLALVHLLPVGCVRLASNAPGYVYAYKYNFVGCTLNTLVPPEVLDDIFVIVLTPKKGEVSTFECDFSVQNNINTKPNFSSLFSTKSLYKKIRNYESDHFFKEKTENGGDLNNFDFKIENLPKMESVAPPRLLSRYMELLLNASLNITTLECALRATRNDWLNNAKLIFQLRHQKEGIDINKIINIIKCSLQDSPVLMFWQSGLSRCYKQAVLNTVNTSSGCSANSFSGISFRVPDLLSNDSGSRRVFVSKTSDLMSTSKNTEINKSGFLSNNIIEE